VARARQLRSGHCLHDGHGRCPHFSDVDPGSVLRRRGRADHAYSVCVCGCHAGCPLVGRGAVAQAVWEQQCTCAAAGPVRERLQRQDERRREFVGVFTDARHEGHLPAEEIESRLRAVFLDRGEDPPPGLRGWAEVVAAGTARRGTRTPRVLWLGVRAVAGTIRWAWQPAGSAAEGGRAGARALYRTAATLALISALLTGAAARASGGRRAGVGVGATLAWSATLGITSVGTAVLHLVRVAEAHTDGRTET